MPELSDSKKEESRAAVFALAKREAIVMLESIGLRHGKDYTDIVVSEPETPTVLCADFDLEVQGLLVDDVIDAFANRDNPQVSRVRSALETIHPDSAGWSNICVSMGENSIDYKRAKIREGADPWAEF